MYGGQLLAQAIMAAARTVDRQRLHSLHSYFESPGDSSLPLLCKVERLRDGRSFAMRRVDLTQNDQTIFTMTASFHADEGGFEHGPDMPHGPGPDEAMSEAEWLTRSAASTVKNLHNFWLRERPFELRPVDWEAFVTRRAPQPSRRIWMRARATLPNDDIIHQALLAYISDYALLDTALLPHGRSAGDADMQAASIDHSIWFHRAFRADQWLLLHEEGITAAHGRGFVRGSFYDEGGRLIATVTQEGLIRLRR
jgi:acyl-CoA thioesterase-2